METNHTVPEFIHVLRVASAQLLDLVLEEVVGPEDCTGDLREVASGQDRDHAHVYHESDAHEQSHLGNLE